jgi:hypothetical protein
MSKVMHLLLPARFCVVSGAVAIALASACSDSDSSSSPTPDVVPYDVTPAALPALDLVGTSTPGDVWTFTRLGGDRYRLTGDKGTPNVSGDDVVREGTLGSLGTVPGNESQDADGIFVFRPDGVGPNEGVLIVRLAGFGYVLALPAGAGQDPVHVVAVERGPCALPASARYRPFEIALNKRPDGFRYPSVGTFAASTLDFVPIHEPTQSWNLGGASCDASGDVRFTTISTPYSRETQPQYPVEAPAIANVVGRFSPAGVLLLDYGKGFGGSISVPEATALPRSEADIATLAPLYRSRAFAGYLTATSVFQPVGATRSDPSVPRTSRSNTFWANLRTTDDHRSSLSLHTLTGDAVAPGTTASFDLSALNTENGGAVLLVNAHDGGLNDLALGGPVIRENGSRTISLVMSGYNGAPSPFLDAISPLVPAGSELVQSLYVAYFTLVPPRNCEAPTLQWPADARPASLAALDRSPPQQVRVRPSSGSIDVSVVDGTGERPLARSNAGPINGVQIALGTPFSLDAPAPGHAWRIFCGPDFLWRPGARQDAQTGRGYASDEPGFGLAEGTYVFEHGPEVDPGGVNPLSKHFVVRVCAAGGCPR